LEHYIDVYAGLPGAGKTIYVQNEIEHLLSNPKNVVVWVGFKLPSRIAEINPKNLFFFDFSQASRAIGFAMDTVYAADEDTFVYLFYDQCRYEMLPGRRDILVAAAKAGVRISVTVQAFHQVDKDDTAWLNKYCQPFIIKHSRAPRLATEDEINNFYR
jgi:hypothetical protein